MPFGIKQGMKSFRGLPKPVRRKGSPPSVRCRVQVRKRRVDRSSLGSSVGDGTGRVAVEIGRSKEIFRRRAVGQVSDGRRHDVPAPSVLEGHCDSKETQRSRARVQASELADLDVDHVHGKILLALENLRDSVDRFVHYEGQVGVPGTDKQSS